MKKDRSKELSPHYKGEDYKNKFVRTRTEPTCRDISVSYWHPLV